MNKINYINFENIKSFGSGNESFKLKFQNCDANSFNIIVAPMVVEKVVLRLHYRELHMEQ